MKKQTEKIQENFPRRKLRNLEKSNNPTPTVEKEIGSMNS
jgi:hypothetical protein